MTLRTGARWRQGRLRAARRRLRNPFDSATTLGRQRILGVLLMIPLFVFFYRTNRFPKLDTIREEVLIATQEEALSTALPASGLSRCFQGFCFGDSTGLLERWWEFSINYIELVTVGMIFAFLVAGIADALLFPGSASGAFGRKGIRGSLQGFVVGPLVMLCSACIVPVANSFRKKGASVEATIAVTQSSSTLNTPALIMLIAVFSPLLWGSRLALSVAGVLLLGPVVAWLVGDRRSEEEPGPAESAISLDPEPEVEPARPWGEVVFVGVRDWMVSAWRFFVRLAPIMVIAGFLAGFAIQFLTEDGVARILGNHLFGVVVAATVGVLINVPLLFEIPLVAGLMILGAGVGPAATLLFAAAAGGPITYWGLSKQIGRRAAGWLAVTTWSLAALGGVVVLGWSSIFPSGAGIPTVTFDGRECSYRGPAALEPGIHTFRVVNDSPEVGAGATMGMIVGRFTEEVGVERLEADLAARQGRAPHYFAATFEHNFVFAGTAHRVDVYLAREGTYAAVCTYGGGAYVVREFSMYQPDGWIEEFRELFTHFVSPKTFQISR